MAGLFDRVGMSISSGGTGDLTLGSRLGGVAPNLASFCSLADASVANGTIVSYLVINGLNSDVEWGTATYSTSGPKLTSRTVTGSIIAGTAGTSAITVDTSAQVFIALRAEDTLDTAETSVASATTTDIGNTATSRIAITGTTTITSLGSQANKVRLVRFAGALTLTYNSTSLILPGAANITTAAGDTAIFQSDSSGNWRCLSYQSGSMLYGVSSVFSRTGAITAGEADYDGFYVSYSNAQSLTDAQRAQQRANVGGAFGNGFVNAFRNPSFQVNQRGTSGSTSSSSGVYTSDGWILGSDGTHSLSWLVFWGYIAGSHGQILQLNPAAGSTDTFIKQRIESYVVNSVLAGRLISSTPNITVQISVDNASGSSVTPTVTVKHATAQDNFGTMTTDVSAVSLGAVANLSTVTLCYTFAWVSGMDNGLEITFDFPSLGSSGTTYLLAADIRSDPGATVGINASPPPAELRNIAFETTFCQRYLFVATNYVISFTQSSTATYTLGTVQFPTPMRAVPADSGVSFTAASGSNGTPSNLGLTTPLQVSYSNGAANWTVGSVIKIAGTWSAEL